MTRRRPTGTPWQRTIRTTWRTPTKWTPCRRTTGRGRTPWTGRTGQRPSWRTPWGPRRPTREWRPKYHLAVDSLPPQEGPVPRARGRHGGGRDDSHSRGRRARAERAGHRQGRDQAAEHGHQRPAAEAGRAGSPWERRQQPPAPGVWLVGRRPGDPDQVQSDPTPPAEPPGVAPAPVPPLSPPPLTTAQAAATSTCRPAVAVRIGVMSGSARSTASAVLYRGHRYTPGAPHQPWGQSQ